MKFSGKGKVKPFPWRGLFFFRARSGAKRSGVHGNLTILGMEMGFTWTFPENGIKKQFFHLILNFWKIMIVRIFTMKLQL